MKKAFLISGFKMNIASNDDMYADLRAAIASTGYEVVPVPLIWNRITVPQYCPKFIEFYNQHKGEHNMVIGNSYGAMVAFLTAATLEPDLVVVCSLSPYFKEDLNKTTEEYRIKRFGKRRSDAQRYLSATETAKEINAKNIPVVLMYGEQEKTVYPHLVKRVKETAAELEKYKLIEVADAPHSFRSPLYIAAIRQALLQLEP